MRSRPFFLLVPALCTAAIFIACVGDDPSSSGPSGTDAGGNTPAEAGGGTDAPVVGNDGGTDAGVDSGPPGEVKWALGFGGAGTEEVNAIAVDSKGNVLIAGGFGSASIDVGCGTALTRTGGGTAIDYDAFVVKYSPDGKCVWAKSFGGAGRDYAQNLALDPTSDAVWIVGSTNSNPLVVAGSNVTGPTGGVYNGFIAKLDSAGNYVTAATYGGAGESAFSGVAVASDGTVVVASTMTKKPGTPISFGSVTAAAADTASDQSYAVVTAFTSAGNPVWARTLRGTGSDPTAGMFVAVDKVGDVIVSGTVAGTLETGVYSSSESQIASDTGGGSGDMFLAKVVGSGTLHNTSWAKVFGGPDDEEPAGIALDGNNAVYFTGGFTTAIPFGGSALGAPGGAEIGFAKFQPGGAHVESRSFSTATSDYAGGVAAAADGSYYVVGSQDTPYDFGTGPTTLNGKHDAFVAAFDATGKAQWVKTFGAGDEEYARRVAVAGSFVYVAGRFESSMSIAGQPVTFAGGADVFVVKMNR